MKYNLVTVLGPTAVGKTRFAVKLSAKFEFEIISADSRQVYRKMDLGTGKDYEDYFIDGRAIPYHLIDIIDPYDEYNLFNFQNDFYTAFEHIGNKNKIPLLVGGTGLYLDSILSNYKLQKSFFDEQKIQKYNSFSIEELKTKLYQLNPKLHNTTDLLIKDRIIRAIIIAESGKTQLNNYPSISSLTIGIKADREKVKKRITSRLKKRLGAGMIEEVDTLIKEGVSIDRLKLFGLEYKFIAMHLNGELNYNDMFQKLNSAIHRFAKKQMTWFRKMEKNGVKIHWFELEEFSAAAKLIEQEINH